MESQNKITATIKQSFRLLGFAYRMSIAAIKLLTRAPRGFVKMCILACKHHSEYYFLQRFSKTSPYYVVYNQDDHKIPLKPEVTHDYIELYADIALVASELANSNTNVLIEQYVDCFYQIQNLSIPSYKKFPIRMPRFKKHNHLALKIVQLVDEPYNCCPSFHVSYSALLFNASQVLPQSLKSKIQKRSSAMYLNVLLTKQHAYTDVAFGILAAKIAFEKSFPNLKFSSGLDLAKSYAKDHKEINANLLFATYSEVKKLYIEKGNFENCIKSYFERRGFPVVRQTKQEFFFDDIQKVAIPIVV